MTPKECHVAPTRRNSTKVWIFGGDPYPKRGAGLERLPKGACNERMRRLVIGCLTAAACAAAAAPASARTAPGQVFAPNPVADLGIQTLTDQKDADYFSADPKLRSAYHRVTLTNLDSSGTLSGDYAQVLSSTGKAAHDTGSGYIFRRDQD